MRKQSGMLRVADLMLAAYVTGLAACLSLERSVSQSHGIAAHHRL